jgi:hypothetical protein
MGPATRNEDARRENTPVLRLGELAVRAGFLSESELQHALEEQQREAKTGRLPRQLGLILLSLGFLSETDLIKLLSEQEKQRSRMGKTEAPHPQKGPPPGVGQKGSVPVIRNVPIFPAKPHPGSGSRPPPRRP